MPEGIVHYRDGLPYHKEGPHDGELDDCWKCARGDHDWELEIIVKKLKKIESILLAGEQGDE